MWWTLPSDSQSRTQSPTRSPGTPIFNGRRAPPLRQNRHNALFAVLLTTSFYREYTSDTCIPESVYHGPPQKARKTPPQGHRAPQIHGPPQPPHGRQGTGPLRSALHKPTGQTTRPGPPATRHGTGPQAPGGISQGPCVRPVCPQYGPRSGGSPSPQAKGRSPRAPCGHHSLP